MSESVIKEVTEELVQKVEEAEGKENAVKIDYKPASEGDRERPWCVSNKLPDIAELYDDDTNCKLFMPIISLFEKKPNDIASQDWVKITVKKKKFMVCKKSLLFMTNCLCEPMYDKSGTVVTHVMVHSPEEKGSDANKEYWKRQFAKYMSLGSMDWEKVRAQVEMKDDREDGIETKLESLTIKDNEQKQ